MIPNCVLGFGKNKDGMVEGYSESIKTIVEAMRKNGKLHSK